MPRERRSAPPRPQDYHCADCSIAKSAPENQEVAMQCADQGRSRPRQADVLSFSASRRRYPGKFRLDNGGFSRLRGLPPAVRIARFRCL